MAKVLVIDDDPSLLRALASGSAPAGTKWSPPTTANRASRRLPWSPPTSSVLDLGLPDIDGLTVCRRIRQWSDVPISRPVRDRRRGPQGRSAGRRC